VPSNTQGAAASARHAASRAAAWTVLDGAGAALHLRARTGGCGASGLRRVAAYAATRHELSPRHEQFMAHSGVGGETG
jgi:hypothetical protein